jgi:hypothetical protein
MRGGANLSDELMKWDSNESYHLNDPGFVNLSNLFNLKAKPGDAEQTVWQNIIETYCKKNPKIKCLWEKPFTTKELEAFVVDETAYRGFFPTLHNKYPSLSREIELIRLFESLTALVQYFFNREYLSCQYQTDLNIPKDSVEENLCHFLKSQADTYIKSPGAQDAKALFASISASPRSSDSPQIILDHHVAHQKSKKVSPFVEGSKLLVKDKVDRTSFCALRDQLGRCSTPEEQLSLVNFNYRRGWHFARASSYSSYAGGII